jgi:hypothetical protein
VHACDWTRHLTLRSRDSVADRLVTCIDPGAVSLVAELRSHGSQANEDLQQWKTHHEERKVIDASPAAITLAMLVTTGSWTRWRRALVMEKSRGPDDQVDQRLPALNRL